MPPTCPLCRSKLPAFGLPCPHCAAITFPRESGAQATLRTLGVGSLLLGICTLVQASPATPILIGAGIWALVARQSTRAAIILDPAPACIWSHVEQSGVSKDTPLAQFRECRVLTLHKEPCISHTGRNFVMTLCVTLANGSRLVLAEDADEEAIDGVVRLLGIECLRK
jgi:hypothetical protein